MSLWLRMPAIEAMHREEREAEYSLCIKMTRLCCNVGKTFFIIKLFCKLKFAILYHRLSLSFQVAVGAYKKVLVFDSRSK